MVDGVRIYLPADNRLDFARFLTADIAEVQIQKGYASVLDGPGAMGGAINLVTRKPTKAFETEIPVFANGDELSKLLEDENVTIEAESVNQSRGFLASAAR